VVEPSMNCNGNVVVIALRRSYVCTPLSESLKCAFAGTGIFDRTLTAMLPDRLELDQEPYLSPSHLESDFLYNTV
jgi:hypothetical protein